MPLETQGLLGLGLGLAFAYALTPMAIRVATRLDFYDKPVGYKGHLRPTPYLGGAAVSAAFVLVVLALTGDWERTLPLVGGVGVLWLVGTVDDRRNVTPLIRVLIEVALALGLWSLGLGWELGLGAALDIVATVLWILAVVNAFNLFDNMDGAAGSMAAVVAGAVAVLGIITNDEWLAVAGAALCGACAGFLPYNLASPARIFLGDGGSMPVGFAVAALVMIGGGGAAPAWQALAMGLLLVGVPALDTALVVVSRTRRGISILTGGSDHLTHRTRHRFRTARAVAVTLGSIQALVSALALVAINGDSSVIVVAVALYLVGAGVAITRLDAGYAASADAEGETQTVWRRVVTSGAGAGLLIPLGIALGLNPVAEGFYDSAVWVLLGIGICVIVAALAIARPVELSRPALLSLAGLASLAGWALLSSAWAESPQQATLEANRLMVYAAVLGAFLLLISSRGAALSLVGAIAATALALALVTVVRMMGGDAGELFVNGRLDAPLGYINGQAAFHLIGFWLCIAAAEQRARPWLGGLAVGAATVLGSLALLSQSRGAALAAVVSAVVVLALVPGRLRRAWALLAVAAGIAITSPRLVEIYDRLSNGQLAGDTIRQAALGVIGAACVAGVAWAAASALDRSERLPQMRRAAAVVLACVGLLAFGTAIAEQARIRATVSSNYHAFVQLGVEAQGSALSGSGSRSRLVSGAGNRYDYWRVAWDATKDSPVAGIGAGGYDVPYFRHRTTTEDIRQPHSLQLQTVSELGLIGGLLLVVTFGGAAWAATGATRRARASEPERMLAVGAIGATTAWAVHTSVDWLHLLPGLTGLALACVAVLARTPAAGPVAADDRSRRPRLVPAAAVGIALAVATVSLARQGLSEYWRSEAQTALAADPARALERADRALRLDAGDVASYYVKAAALARFDRGEAADATLREAARREPRDFVTWALLGDIAVRRGDLAAAATRYNRALALNPRDPGLQRLAKDPASALDPVASGESG